MLEAQLRQLQIRINSRAVRLSSRVAKLKDIMSCTSDSKPYRRWQRFCVLLIHQNAALATSRKAWLICPRASSMVLMASGHSGLPYVLPKKLRANSKTLRTLLSAIPKTFTNILTLYRWSNRWLMKRAILTLCVKKPRHHNKKRCIDNIETLYASIKIWLTAPKMMTTARLTVIRKLVLLDMLEQRQEGKHQQGQPNDLTYAAKVWSLTMCISWG